MEQISMLQPVEDPTQEQICPEAAAACGAGEMEGISREELLWPQKLSFTPLCCSGREGREVGNGGKLSLDEKSFNLLLFSHY